MNRLLLFWISAALILAGVMLLRTSGPDSRNPTSAPAVVQDAARPESDLPKLTAFELLDQTGARVNSDAMKGKVWTGSFFFCSCPSTCYNQNMKIAELQAEFAPAGLVSLSITCDPDNDTTAALARYATRFNADFRSWKFLTPIDGDVNYVRRIGNDFFGVMVAEETHTDRVIVIDRNGEMRGAFSVLKPEQFAKLRETVRELINEPSSEGPSPTATPESHPSTGPDAGDQARR